MALRRPCSEIPILFGLHGQEIRIKIIPCSCWSETVVETNQAFLVIPFLIRRLGEARWHGGASWHGEARCNSGARWLVGARPP